MLGQQQSRQRALCPSRGPMIERWDKGLGEAHRASGPAAVNQPEPEPKI